MNFQRGAGRTQRVVFMRPRCAEQRHHSIADVLVHGAAIIADETVHELRVAAYQIVQLFRVLAGQVSHLHVLQVIPTSSVPGVQVRGVARQGL